MSRLTKRRLMAVGLSAIAIASAAGCSSGTKKPAAGSGQPTYTLGVLTDLTGPAASTEASVPLGVKAAVGLANSEGYHLKYVVADAATSPTAALQAAQKLVDQDHVFAVIAVSALTFAASSYLSSHGVPVIGASVDGPEWKDARNMFAIDGVINYNQVSDLYGRFFKMEGANNIATLGYGITPSSKLSTEGAAVSAQTAGLRVGYQNANFPFGSTNVGPVVIAMKNAGINGFYGGIETSTSFALIEALRAEGVALKAALLPIGYGGDLTSGGPSAAQAAQGVYFTVGYEPVEMHTTATTHFQNALKTYAGVTGDPTFNEYLSYLSVDGFLTGLKAAGQHPTQSSFINAMLGIRSYDAAGLYGSHTIGFAMDQRGGPGANNCSWITRFSGSTFQLVAGADPVCGNPVPGKTVS